MGLFDKEVKEKKMKLSNVKKEEKNLKILIQSIIRKKIRKTVAPGGVQILKITKIKKIVPIKQC